MFQKRNALAVAQRSDDVESPLGSGPDNTREKGTRTVSFYCLYGDSCYNTHKPDLDLNLTSTLSRAAWSTFVLGTNKCTHTHIEPHTLGPVMTLEPWLDILTSLNTMKCTGGTGLGLLLHWQAESWEGIQSGSITAYTWVHSKSNGGTGQLPHSWHCPRWQNGITLISIHPAVRQESHYTHTAMKNQREGLLKVFAFTRLIICKSPGKRLTPMKILCHSVLFLYI